jgi:release factor glutamine methyltransferase
VREAANATLEQVAAPRSEAPVGLFDPRIEGGISIEAARRALASKFRSHGLDAPELAARVLVAHALGLDHAGLMAQAARALTPQEAGILAAMAARRLAREPVARIVGHKEFWGLPLAVNAETLLPRPESETVIEAALAARCEHGDPPTRIADLGTGSGALLLALLSELPGARGIGTDISSVALGCARANAAALGLSERTLFLACDYGSALAGPLDLIVCNPPYVARGDIAALAPEVREFDPPRALDGGPDGLAGYRAIAPQARRLLAPDGVLVVELGFGQLTAACSIFAAAGLAPGAARHDLSGVARAVVVRPLP